MKPYVFGHRGASGYEIENTLPSFKKAVRMGAGIETDVQETKEKKLTASDRIREKKDSTEKIKAADIKEKAKPDKAKAQVLERELPKAGPDIAPEVKEQKIAKVNW